MYAEHGQIEVVQCMPCKMWHGFVHLLSPPPLLLLLLLLSLVEYFAAILCFRHCAVFPNVLKRIGQRIKYKNIGQHIEAVFISSSSSCGSGNGTMKPKTHNTISSNCPYGIAHSRSAILIV